MRLGDLMRGWNGGEEAASLDITGITADSRAVRPGMVFAALPGARSDGPGGRPSAINPSVPSEAAFLPASRQIWRRKSTLLVLPFVPVIATTHSGCVP